MMIYIDEDLSFTKGLERLTREKSEGGAREDQLILGRDNESRMGREACREKR
jgi:hypothetical protein